MIYSSGEIIPPWGTPEVSSLESDKESVILTTCDLSDKKEPNHFTEFSSRPYSESFLHRISLSKQSNAALRCRLNAEKGNTTEKIRIFSNLPALSCAVSKELSQHYFINQQSNFLKLCFPHFVVVDGKRIKQQTYLKASRQLGTHTVGCLSALAVVSG